MNHRERLQKALNHETADRIPVDFGGTSVTGMHVTCVAALRDYYGLDKQLVKVQEPYQMLGCIEDDLADVLGIDIIGISGRNTLFGFPNEDWKEMRMPWNQDVLVSKYFNTTTDAKGDLLIYPKGDTRAPPSGRMPTGGYFFDTIIRQEKIDDNKLDPEDNLEEFTQISEEDLNHLEFQIESTSVTDKPVIASFGGTAFGDIALIPAPFLTNPKGIRDVAEWYISTVTRKDYIHKVFSRQAEIALENLAIINRRIGDKIDVVFICGTDFGTQTGSFCSTDTFDSLYGPYYKKINHWVHQNTKWKTFKHSCGAVEPFMSHFIEAGFDIINPVQLSATGMNPKNLKSRYGEGLVFWGGGVDTQKTLPFGSVDQVRKEVFECCEIFSQNGGFIFNAVHNIQAKTPTENIVAMFDAVKEFNGISRP